MDLHQSTPPPTKRPRTTTAQPTYHIILFYNYRKLPASPMDIPSFCKEHKQFCKSLCLTGRVLVADEGINGSVASVDRSKLDQYTEMLKAHPLYDLQESDFKRSTGALEPFPDLFIKPVKEIINTGGLIEVPNAGEGGTHLTPQEFHAKLVAGQQMKSKKETVVLDIRNHTEYMVGHFESAIDPNLRTFAEFPKYLEKKAEELKNKTVLMYCTGGIRCEKASFHLKKSGVDDVYQLQGGVHKYLEAYPDGGEWLGKNFVFDKRVFQPVPHLAPEKQIVGECYQCQKKFDELDGEAICTVCRDMVLVCHECRPGLKHQYHCNQHAHLSSCYFTDLIPFSVEELVRQRDELRSILFEMEKCGGKGGEMKKTKNKRKTIRKQVDKLEKEMAERRGNTKKSGANDGSKSIEEMVEDHVVGGKRKAVSAVVVAKCRTCGLPTGECAGACWGIWKKK